MCDKDETNYVAKAQNWDQRVKGELESARVSHNIKTGFIQFYQMTTALHFCLHYLSNSCIHNKLFYLLSSTQDMGCELGSTLRKRYASRLSREDSKVAR